MFVGVFDGNIKLRRMNVSVVHAVIVILSYLFGIPGYILAFISIGYYVTDTIYEFIRLKLSIFRLSMIHYHLVTIVGLTYFDETSITNYIYYAFYLAEISNLPLYLAYQLKKMNYQQKVIDFVIFVEILGYVVLRLCLYTEIAYRMMLDVRVPVAINVASVLMIIISAVWTYSLVTKLALQYNI